MRFVVLASACVLAVITYIHRVGFATAIAEIKGPLGLTDGHLGWLMASFMVAYGLFEMPWGSLGDRLGVRNILAAIILGGSALTAALVLVVLLPEKVAWIFIYLLVVRFLFGAFQAGTFPSISRMMADWMPLQERGGAQGLLWMSSRVGGAAAPSLLVWLIAVMGNWEAPVLLAACLGAVWCAVFWPWFRNQPEEMRQVNQAELKIIASGRAAKAAESHGKIPWSAMVQSRSVVALCAMYGFLGYSGNFFLTLLPTYLKNHRHLSSETAGLLTSMPFACGTVACLMGGAMSDLIIRRWGPRWGRRHRRRGGNDARVAVDSLHGLGRHRATPGCLALPDLHRQRPGDGPRLGRRGGYRRPPHRRSLRRHEHDGQPHRGPRGTGHGLPVRIGTHDIAVRHLRRQLCAGRDFLAGG